MVNLRSASFTKDQATSSTFKADTTSNNSLQDFVSKTSADGLFTVQASQDKTPLPENKDANN